MFVRGKKRHGFDINATVNWKGMSVWGRTVAIVKVHELTSTDVQQALFEDRLCLEKLNFQK